uniref:helix-turn-helix domain-containing protein n=1 Tax=Dysosmobacter welbionis TaxID=2093857 RepID=UPI003FF05F92
MGFDERIRQLRQARGISQVELSAALDVTKQSVSNWENNNIQPSIDILIRLSRYFSVSTDYILGLDERKYIEITGLTDKEVTHIQQIIDDIKNRKGK